MYNIFLTKKNVQIRRKQTNCLHYSFIYRISLINQRTVVIYEDQKERIIFRHFLNKEIFHSSI